MVQKVLNAVCDRFDGCETLAYADLSTQVVLATNAACTQSRDELNDLCSEATLVLEGGGHVGIIGTVDGFRLFLRAEAEPADGLICVCDLEVDMALLMSEATQCLAAISGEDAAG